MPSLARIARTLLLLLLLPVLARGQAHPRPDWLKGVRLRVKIDSSPAQAAIYIDSKELGLQGYTPSEFKLPRGSYKIILELPGFKTEDQLLNIDRAQAFTFTLARQARPAVIDLRLGPDRSALAASISIDGQTIGTVPNQIEVAPGSHLVEVRRAGFRDYRDAVQLGEGERRTLTVMLTAEVKAGALVVSADQPGAEVFVDGARRDTAPAVIGDLSEGEHSVEVRKEPLTPWKQIVRVVGGQQTKVLAQLQPTAPVLGALKVISQTPLANVLLDGDAKGPANAELRDLRPGSHVLELRAAGFDAKRVEVDVKPGEFKVIPLDLSPTAPVHQTASLRIVSPLPDADLFLDGAPAGHGPIDRSDLSPGKHYVVIQKAGFGEFKTAVELEAGKSAQVIPSAADMPQVVRGPTPEEQAAHQREFSSFSALTVDRYKGTVDVGVGDPFFVFARVTSGVFRRGNLGGDLSVELRTSFFETDVGVRPRLQLFRADPIALGAELSLLGGGGPYKRNGITFEIGPILTLLTGSVVQLSVKPYLQFYSDRLCPSVDDIQEDDRETGKTNTPGSGVLWGQEKQICKAYDLTRNKSPGTYPLPDPMIPAGVVWTGLPADHQDTRERFSGVRFMAQAVLDIAVAKNMNLWALLEGAPWQGQRQAYTSKFNFAYTDNDFPFYIRFGITGKF